MITGEDRDWVYGETIVDGKAVPWVQAKGTFWLSDSFRDIVRKHLRLPLNDEMIKQASSSRFDGDLGFLYALHHVCRDLPADRANFAARIVMANRDVEPAALRHLVVTGFAAGVTPKAIEAKLAEIRARCENE